MPKELMPCPFCGAIPNGYEYTSDGEFICAKINHKETCYLASDNGPIGYEEVKSWNKRAKCQKA